MEQSPPEHPSHPDSLKSVDVAEQWLRLVRVERDISGAWPITAVEFRLALVQAVIYLNEHEPLLAGYERDDLARQLAVAIPDHALWTAFANLLAEEFLVDLGQVDPKSLGPPEARSMGPGLELVLFPLRDGDPDERYEIRAPGVLVKAYDDGWAVAGLSGRPAVPGWPPDLGY